MTAAPAARDASRVLVVDDSADDIALLVEFLRRTNLRIAVATDGMEGYRKAQVLRPDIILMDVRMPGTDGYAACRLLKADPGTRDIPVIFLSGASELDDRLQGLRLGAVDYISKPFAAEEVLARLQVHLELLRRMRDSGAPAEGAGPGSPAVPAPNATVTAAMALLEQDIGRTPVLADLAQQVGTNERRLTELFREATGTTVFAWLREQRFQLACRLLRDSDLEIQQVAEHVGYGGAGNFTAMFRERMGITPREYRQVQREPRA